MRKLPKWLLAFLFAIGFFLICAAILWGFALVVVLCVWMFGENNGIIIGGVVDFIILFTILIRGELD